MSYLELYLLTRLDALCITFISIALTSALGVVISLYLYSEAYDKDGEKLALSWVRKFAASLCAFTLLAVVTPTQEDAIVIYGMHWATNNEDVKNIPDDAVRVIREWINEASPKSDTTLTTNGGKP